MADRAARPRDLACRNDAARRARRLSLQSDSLSSRSKRCGIVLNSDARERRDCAQFGRAIGLRSTRAATRPPVSERTTMPDAIKIGSEILVNTTTLGAQEAPVITRLTNGGFV